MRSVSLKNNRLLETLNEFSSWMFSHDSSLIDKLYFGNRQVSSDIGCSYEYLIKAQSQEIEEYGYPEISVGFDLHTASSVDRPEGWKEIADKLNYDIISILGVEFNALMMYYPEDGYIGWHHNANCAGQNLIMTYSPPGGKGYFEYQDPVSKDLIRVPDPEGWSAKVGYFGSFTEPDKIVWHCAKSVDTPRLTISYVIRDQWMWDEMIQDIESDQ